MPRYVPDVVKARALDLRSAGHTFEQIADALQVEFGHSVTATALASQVRQWRQAQHAVEFLDEAEPTAA